MTPTERMSDLAYEAGRAYSELNTFASIQAILEGGIIHGDNRTATKIIKLCKMEIQRQLFLFDAAKFKIQDGVK